MNTPMPAGSGDSSAAVSSGAIVAVGRIGKAHGIRGDVFVEPWTDDPQDRFADGTSLITDPADRGPLTVESSRDHSGKLIVHFAGVETRNAAEQIRGALLVVAAAQRPAIEDPDEFYDTDLIGLAARTVSGESLGPVTDVLHSAAGSVLAIDFAGREVLVPFLKAMVPVVDLAGGTLDIDPPDGLLDVSVP
jgi:16S rRNA processing protein RimM